MIAIGLSAMAQQKIQLRSTDKSECVSSDMNSLRATFSFSTIEAEDYSSDRGTFSWISLPNTVLGGEVGNPQVPVINELIAVPYGATPRIEVTRYSTTDYSLEDYGIKTLVPRQLPVRKNQNLEDVPFVMNEDAYQTRGLRSEPHAAVSVDGTMRGVQLGKMTIDPVSYDPVSNTIRVFNDIEVMVHFDGADAQTTKKMLMKTYSPAFDAVYSQLFNNKAITDVYTDHPDLYNTPVRILVICYSGFRDNDALNTWLKWKLQKGYYVDIFYTDETGTSASNIASFIKTKYNASVSDGNAYTYLIVIGDTGQVPYYMVKNIDSSIGNCASDLGYSSVNFSSSTSNYFPDMYYSRISVENTTQLTNYINKVLTYEKYTFSDGGNYLNNVILVGGYDANWTNRVAKPTINYATNYYFNSSNNTYGGFSGGTINATISTSSTQGYSGTNNGCYNGINNGACLLNYTAHGDKQEWQGPQFTAAQVATLTNTGKYFFGVGNCCLTGNFNNTTTSYSPGSSIGNNACFAEAMIRVPNAGAVAYIGCSPYSYWYEDFYWAVGAHSYSQGNYPTTSASSTGVYDAMFMDQNWNSASALLYLGNLAVQTAVSNGNQTSSITDGDCNNSAHYYFQFYHTFGDGSVMPYVTKPETNTVTIPSSVTSGANSVTINAVAGSYVAVTDNNSVIYGVAEANASGVANVVFTNAIPGSGTLYVVVTRQQYQPYFGTTQIVGGTPYNITCNQPLHGTISAPAQAYANTLVTLTANPETGYCLSSWNVRDANNNSITVTNNQFTMPSSNVTMTATFVQGLQVTLAPVTNGSISAEPLYALQGMTINLTATAAQGYEFGNWVVYKTGDPNTTVTVNGNSFTMPNYPVTVSANFLLEPSELTVYDGTATNQYIPMYGYYFDDYTKSECIIPASQLTAMNGSTISSITFYPSSVNTSSWGESTQTVFLKEVTGTTLGGSYSGTTGATIVKTASPLDMPVAGTPYTITFDTPYSYNGGNLLIGVYNTDDDSYNKVEWYGTSNLTSGVSAYGYNGSNLNNVSYNAQSFLPKTTFTYTPASSPYLSLVPNSATMITGSTETLTATYGNVTGTPNITYTSSNTSIATVTGSGTTATVTAVTPGTATITATMTVNGTPHTATCAVTVETPNYCTPGTGNYDNDGISNVTFGTNGVVVNNTVNGINYGDYSNLVGAVESGTTCQVDITYKTGYTYGTVIWVDWNNNYTFEGTEVVYAGQSGSDNPTTLAATFDVPATTPVGEYRMRIIGSDMGLDSYTGSISAAANADPCGTYSYSTCHDYTLSVIAASTNPSIYLTPTTATVVLGSTQTLTATIQNVTGTPNITYTSSNTSVATVSGSGTTATVTAVTPGTTTITATMTVNGTPYTATCAVTVETPNYCTPSFGSNTDCITNVTLGSINNTTASSSTNGYGDHTSMSTDLEAGTNVTLSLTSGSGSGTHAAAVWIDFDDSYSFETSERVGTQDNISASATVTINLTIPDNVPVGNHRMRVVYQYNVSAAIIDPCPSASYGEAEDYTVIITSSCAIPTGLTISGITAHGVTATWNAEAGELFDYAMVSGYNIDPATVTTYDGSMTATGTTCSMSWNNLLASNDYTVVIRKNCGNEEYSNAISRSFITEAICPTPTNLTASNITQSSATISWNSNTENYNVMYREATVTGTTLNQIFFDSFENDLNNWTIYINGYVATNTENSYNITDWHQQDLSSNEPSAHTGNYAAMSRSYDGSDRTVDNWLVTPQMTLGDVLKFWVVDDGTWHEYYEVYVSTETNAISDFTRVAIPGDASDTWDEKTVDLSAYAGQTGYIAIRHTDYGKDWLFIDDFGVYNTVNTYSYGTAITVNTTDNSCNLPGLNAENTYQVQVQADCGAVDGTSNWSSPIYFTTPDACSAPTDLVSSNITSNSVTLGWADNQDSYNVRYRKVYFHEDFESETMPTGWTSIDANQDGNTWYIGHATTHSGNNGAANISYIYNTSGTSPDDYLVSPMLDLQGTLRVWLSGYGERYQENFAIYLSTTGNSAADFTTTLIGETNTTNEYVEYTADLSSYAGQQGYIAIRHFNCSDQYYLYVDDFGLYGSENWTTENANTATVTLTGLSAETGYEWQVQGVNCDGQSSTTVWSEVAGFETVEGCHQITAANLPYNEGFENMTTSTEKKTGIMPTCWTLAYEDYAPMADTARPQVFYADGKPASGDYCLFMFGMGILAMPQLADDLDISTLKMSFALRQHKLITQLQVGVMSDLSDETTFTPLATFDNGANTEVQHYVVDFRQYSGNDSPKYIAFRNILAPGHDQQRSVQYIDDISIYVANSADDPDPDHACGIEVPYSQNFDNLTANTTSLTGITPDCWNFIAEADNAVAPQVSFGTDNAQSGNYSLYMTGRGYLALPEITNAQSLSGLSVSFFVRQKKYAQRLQVGVMTDPDDESTFVKIADIYNNGNYSTPVQHTVSLAAYSGNGKHIAFRNVATNASAVSYNWIDDISVFETPAISCGITVPYEQGFENGIPDCWTFSPDLEGAAAPQISGEYASSGNNSLYMSGMGTFALPEITNVNDLSGLTLTFSVRQRKFAHRIAVGVMTDPSDPNTFVEIERFYNGGVYNMPVEHSVDLGAYSGNGRHIAFRNIVTNSNTVSQQWIDDISIDLTQARSAEVTQGGYETADLESAEEALAPLGVDGFDINTFTVWPNPTTGALTLGMEAQRVEVNSLTGQKVAVFENTSRIDISNLPAGVYILKVTLPQGNAVRKIVKR